MEVLVAVIDAGGLSAAARRLGLTRAAVSRQLGELERRLGTRLIQRTTRRAAATDAGLAYAEQARRILAEVDEVEREVQRGAREPRGLLRVSAPMSFGTLHLAPLLGDFLRRHPGLSIEIVQNDRFVDLIEDGVDLAIRIGDLPDSSLVARRLASARRVVIAAPGYVDARGEPRRPAELMRHDCLCYTYQQAGETWRFVAPDGRETRVRVTSRLRCNNGDTLRVAALDGLGIALLPLFIVGRDLQAGTLQSLLPGFDTPAASVYAVRPAGRHAPARIGAFIDFLAERFGPRPYWDLVA
jgi:DNA-binding transcriptional LysR family regulator